MEGICERSAWKIFLQMYNISNILVFPWAWRTSNHFGGGGAVSEIEFLFSIINIISNTFNIE